MVNDAPAKTPLKSQFSFPQFPHLPKEIRLLIWDHALPKPRVIYLEQHFPKSIIRPRVPKVDGVDIRRLALMKMLELYSDEQLEKWRRSRKQIKRSKIQEWRDRRFGDWNANYEIPEEVKDRIAIVERGE
jgi:hypothetical protein